MPKGLARAGRAVGRILRPIPRLRSNAVLIVQLLGLVGIGLAASYVQSFKAWLAQDPAHIALVVVAVLFALAFLAMNGYEKELEDLTVVKVREFTAGPPTHHKELHGSDGESFRNVLRVQTKIALRNEGQRTASVAFPGMSVLIRKARRKWEPLPVIERSTTSSLREKREGGGWHAYGDSPWRPHHRHEVAAGAEKPVSLTLYSTLPPGAAAPHGQDIKIRFTLDVVGQSDTECEYPITPMPDRRARQ